MQKVKIYKINDLIEMLGVTRVTVIKYIREGKIKGFKIGNTWRVTEEAFLEYIHKSENDNYASKD